MVSSPPKTVQNGYTVMVAVPMNPIERFLSRPFDEQIKAVRLLSEDDREELCDRCFDYLSDNADEDVTDAVAEILRRISPEEYDELHQDLIVRDRLTASGLARIRAATYESAVRPLLHSSVAEQEWFLARRDKVELRELLDVLDRYAKHYGRSARCRDVESLVRQYLEKK